ncbi:hypothetical protein T492DRAFT_833762 [Pavlovales sp. CCMP2436]|nr:hypothetical protein T492DRAFT_833762 [Pavlovales sp. CCMP2436]
MITIIKTYLRPRVRAALPTKLRQSAPGCARTAPRGSQTRPGFAAQRRVPTAHRPRRRRRRAYNNNNKKTVGIHSVVYADFALIHGGHDKGFVSGHGVPVGEQSSEQLTRKAAELAPRQPGRVRESGGSPGGSGVGCGEQSPGAAQQGGTARLPIFYSYFDKNKVTASSPPPDPNACAVAAESAAA